MINDPRDPSEFGGEALPNQDPGPQPEPEQDQTPEPNDPSREGSG